MAVPEFSEYTYRVSYKDNESAEEVILSEGLRIIEAKTNIIDGSGASVEAPNPNYDYFMNTLNIQVKPKKNVILIVVRNQILDGESVAVESKEVFRTTTDFLDYDRRVGYLITDAKVGTSDNKRLLLQILNVNETEHIPCRYVFTGVEFTNIPTEEQHVDISYKKTSDSDFIPLGTNITVPSTGVLDGIELGELPDDTDYTIKIYHREQEKEKLFTFRTNIVPTIGKNPIIGLVEWNGRIMLLDAPDVKARLYPDKSLVQWMFPMDYSTKSFDNILSSLWTSDGYQTNKEEYHFSMRTSSDNEAETYVGCEITKDHYIALPINYVNEKLPDLGASMNIHYKDLFKVTNEATERNTIFIKFYIDASHNGPVKLFNFNDGTTEKYIGIDVDGSTIKFNAFGNTQTLTGIQKNKWYTLILVCKSNYIIYASITDSSNYVNGTIPIGSGAHIGDIDSKAKLYDAGNKQLVALELTYDATTNVADNSLGICINYCTYQYIDNTPENNPILKGHTDYIPISAGTDKKIIYTVPNDAAYGIAVGYSLVFLYGGTTMTGTVTIKDLKVNGNSIMSDIPSAPFVIDSGVNGHIAGTRTALIFTKTGDTIQDPVGGLLLSNIQLNGIIVDDAQCFMGKPLNANMNDASYVVSRVGFNKATITGNDSWGNPYQYLDNTVFESLGGGYKKMPSLECVGESSTIIIPTSAMTEMKDTTVRFLLDGLPVGEVDIKVMSGTDVLSTTHRTIKSIKMSPAEVSYDIDFESNFNNAVIELKKRYYAKQKRWGGNMGGGTHGALIYFNSKEKCLILEQHGDKYRGPVPAVAPAGAEGYGLPVDIIECPSTFPYPLEQRSTRVGGLLQSVDYHPYGMFDCWFQVPKGMVGLAICLWYFHYQEIYSYDKTFKFWTEEGVNGYNYAHCVKTGYGATWVVINNEIDMELGSENTPYRTNVNPNTDQSIYWYVPGLSIRQMIGCTAAGENYGTWILDWDASKSVIDSVTETNPQSSNAYLRSDRLKWVKVMDTIDEVNYGANTRSCRFNNWMAEQWNDGCGVYGTPASSRLGLDELTVNNRTPLGRFDLQAAVKYAEHYYDDGEYHKWSIDWTNEHTRLLIDDEEIAICKAFIPFNPMTMLIGCWFPSANTYDKATILGEWGTWSGVHANWDVALMKVKRIKFEAYTEEQVPTTNMRYDCETYGEDGLKTIL